MNPTETIQAAIDKLEGLRRTGTEGAWSHKRSLDNHWIESNDRIALAEAISLTDAELIVTLHRTIEAQLAILRNQGNRGHVAAFNLVPVPESDSGFWGAVALARAILGEES